jgi:hypothetical protein
MKVRAEALAKALWRLPVAATYARKVVQIAVPEHRPPRAEDIDPEDYRGLVSDERMQVLTFHLTQFARGDQRWYEYVLEVE